MFKEFKDFIMTGNVVDLAVAVILAAAIGLVVNSLISPGLFIPKPLIRKMRR